MKFFFFGMAFLLSVPLQAMQRVEDQCRDKLIPVVTSLAFADGWNPKMAALTGAKIDFFGKVKVCRNSDVYSVRFTYARGYSNYSDYLLYVKQEDCKVVLIEIKRM